ncbi:MAG: hypothetical protein OXF74_07290 [Rhodobacteraceae bacterium]|nr:hypothetical protein [Paracoccaceae bacterium]
MSQRHGALLTVVALCVSYPTSTPAQPVSATTDILASAQRQAGFAHALEQAFPMTPDMVRSYRETFEENEIAVSHQPYPETLDDAVLVTLQPGEQPVELRIAPGLATVVGFFDAAGNAWPIRQYVIGNGEEFQVTQLGEDAGALAISPLSRVGWTNLVILLSGEESPAILKIIIDNARAHVRRSIQIAKLLPGTDTGNHTSMPDLPVAGDRRMLAALTGAGLPEGMQPVPIVGVDAIGWISGDALILRSRHALLSPHWLESLAGPGGIRAYRLNAASALLFSVDGRIVQARIELP